MNRISGLLVLGAWLILIACSTHEPEQDLAPSKALLSVSEVQAWLEEDPTVVFLEISKPNQFTQGHIPGAQHLWRPDLEDVHSYPFTGMRVDGKKLERLLGSKGIQSGQPIIIYDHRACVEASRLHWMLEYFGYTKVYLLNGGKEAWERAGAPLELGSARVVEHVDFRFETPPNSELIATFAEVYAALQDTSIILVDTREEEEYLGQAFLYKKKAVPYKPGAFDRGSIPGAVHLNWAHAVDLHGDHCFKSLEDIRYNLQRVGIDSTKTIIAYCQSGVRSAHMTFVLRHLLGFPKVKNYDGSWIEWSYKSIEDPALPVIKKTEEAKFKAQLLALEKASHSANQE
ncbi:MAG: rhodanese-like domain-containing protein [Bacteroidota bacterium]